MMPGRKSSPAKRFAALWVSAVLLWTSIPVDSFAQVRAVRPAVAGVKTVPIPSSFAYGLRSLTQHSQTGLPAFWVLPNPAAGVPFVTPAGNAVLRPADLQGGFSAKALQPAAGPSVRPAAYTAAAGPLSRRNAKKRTDLKRARKGLKALAALKLRLPASWNALFDGGRSRKQAGGAGAGVGEAAVPERSERGGGRTSRRKRPRHGLRRLFRPKPRFDPGTRIAVIGAGAAGLMAAEELKKKGYRNITVLERGEAAGGKVHSIPHNGRVYDMGAVLSTPTYLKVRRLAKRFGVKGVRHKRQLIQYSLASGESSLYPTLRETGSFLWDLAKYFWFYTTRWRGAARPGLDGVAPALSASFSDVMKNAGLPVFHEFAKGPATAFGYGFSDEVPAAYWIKYLNPIEAMSYFLWTHYKDGYQEIWTRLAAEHDVRYGTNIRSVDRGKNVTIRTDKGDLEFDRLIISSPLDESLKYLDASDRELELFSKIRTYDYRTYLIEFEGLPPTPGMGAYLPENFNRARMGHPMVWYHRFKDNDTAVVYVQAEPSMSDEEIEANIAEDMAKLGARVKRVVAKRRWKHFPHVSPEDMSSGFYGKLRRLQGARNTYYAGEVLSFSSVKHTSDFSADLVKKEF